MVEDVNVTPVILRVLENHWDETAMPYEKSRVNGGDGMVFQSGWYSRHGDRPIVTVTGESGTVVSGGRTGTSAMGFRGEPLQLWQGAVDVNCVAGQQAHLESAGPNGDAVNPKDVRDAMWNMVREIMRENRPKEFRAVAADSYNQRTDTDAEGGPVFRTVARVSGMFMIPDFETRTKQQ